MSISTGKFVRHLLDGKTFATHNGSHHSDDVIAIYFLEMLGASVRRISRDVVVEDDVILFDMGGGKYDHHHKSAAVKADGSPYSSAGLILADYEDAIVLGLLRTEGIEATPSIISTLREKLQEFIAFIDSHDNGIRVESKYSWFPAAISALEAVSERVIAVDIYSGDIQSISSQTIGEDLLVQSIFSKMIKEVVGEVYITKALYSATEVLVLDVSHPWSTSVQLHNELNPTRKVLSVVYLSNTNQWNIQQVPVCAGSFDMHQTLPVSWLEQQPEGCVFVHKNLFLAVFSTKECAINAVHSLY